MPIAKRRGLTLLPGQCSIWIVQRIGEAGPVYGAAAYLEINGKIDSDIFTDAINRVFAGNKLLPVRIAEDDGTPSPALYTYSITGNIGIALSLLILNYYTELALLASGLNACLDLSKRALAEQISHEPENIQEYGRFEGEEIGCGLGWLGGGRKNLGPVINLIPYDRNEISADHPIALKHFPVRPIEDFSITAVLGMLGPGAAYLPSGPQLALALALAGAGAGAGQPLEEPRPGRGRGI